MPELPETETYKQLLTEKIAGKTIEDIIITREKSINVGVEAFTEALKGKALDSIGRRGKHLIFHLSSNQVLVLHLMLGGWMYFGNDNDSPDRTKQISLIFSDGTLYFIGLRLGYLHLLTEADLENLFKDLGPEPLTSTFTESLFHDMLKKRKGALKTLLTNQHFIAGIGNFYSDEICFEAKILPMTKANALTDEQTIVMYRSIKKVLQRGIQEGGYMDNPFFQHDNHTGGVQAFIYDKEGEACPRCSGPIQKGELSGRKTFFCIGCQV